MDSLKEMWDKVKSLFSSAAEKIEEQTRITKLKIDISTIERKITRVYTEIGQKIFELSQEKVKDVMENEAIAKSIEDILEYQKEIKKIEEEIEKIKAEVPEVKSIASKVSGEAEVKEKKVKKAVGEKKKRANKPKLASKPKASDKPKS